ncbi:MAG: SusC/RagA family TonB-linked outer membrane protein [Prolixibacteraceae bacterium]|jgi:TonB-linked SusC/RagA family outer membrane protein|nr:SusC/RagA family TonB-linked outer membrane protein [Prolixibacteraceae bacterium]
MKKLLCYFILALVLSPSLFAQGASITGKVLDEDKTALPGVNVVLKGTTTGTVTDINGIYTINAPDENSIIVYSFIGFYSQELTVGSQTTIDVTLIADTESLDEVIVIGYGQVKKEDATGAVATLGTKDFNQGVSASPQELIGGRIAGVSVTSNSGAPGAGSTIRIRGGSSLGGASNDPLIVIDGFPVDDGNISGLSNPLSTLNPNDIESFTVLKDASAAAIYGSRASNGVIIITTKKGVKGKLKVDFSSQVSMSTPIEYTSVLDGDEYRALINSRVAEGKSGLNADIAARMGTENTDWQNEIFRNAISHNQNLSLAGSIGNIPFRASYGYTDQQGILKTTETSRHTMALNINPTFLDDHLKVDLNVKGTFANTNFGVPGAIGNAVTFDPTQPVMNNNSRYGGYFQWTEENLENGSMNPEGIATTFTENPVAQLALRNNVADVNRLIGNMHLEYKMHFLPELKAHLNLGIDKTNTEGKDDYLPGSTFTIREYNDEFGRKYDYTNNSSSELLDAYLNYTKEFGQSNFNFTAGYSWQHWRRGNTVFDRNTAEDYIILDSRTFNGEETDNPNENYLISLYGRLIYMLSDKYILTATVRQDGSSRFLGENQTGIFPSVALAWKIHEEDFLKDVDAISALKLRLGYGITGQQGLDPSNGNVSDAYYPALAKYGLGTGFSDYPIGPNGAPVQIARPEPYDANLKWEETTTYNLGLDFGLWDDRLTGSVDLYDRETIDLLNLIPVADGSNFGNYILTNVGNMDIKGYELTLTGRIISTADFNWTVGANLTYNERTITKLNKTDDPSDAGVETGNTVTGGGLNSQVQIHTVGQAPNSFYTFQQVFDAEDNPIEGVYVDRSGEGGDIASNTFNKYHNHSPNADYLMGINSRLNYKKFDFSFSGRLSLGNYVYNNGASSTTTNLYSNDIFFNNIRTSALNIGFEGAGEPWSDIYVQDASFFKMDNISLGYTLDKIVKGVNARIGFTVQNAFIITEYEGLDPEVQGGIDNNLYPRPRTFLFSLNLNF